MKKQETLRAYERWDKDEETQLLSLHEEGKTPKEIASILGRRSSAIKSRLNKILEREAVKVSLHADKAIDVQAEEIPSSTAEKGRAGEAAFAKWLDATEIGYVAIKQNPADFAKVFTKSLKRPDFLVLVDRIGLIAVDVKNHSSEKGYYTINVEKDVVLSAEFESQFQMCFWFAYRGDGIHTQDNCWYFINAIDAINRGEKILNEQGEVGRLQIPIESCIKVPEGGERLGVHLTRQKSEFGVISKILRNFFSR